ncbi:GspMb/PilO family protein [Thermospira aquatica]|uniref:Uncharacterized protein n=1 Tax=Thermospira aquatica TaxID=2828656 RepID=A0AAX3BAK5_9SPIR|nr:GspMb/PilO family protein [Thermospira aquatica]URA09299.1 hypothetical protein KDW03_07295 [Thermospira aquatica]
MKRMMGLVLSLVLLGGASGSVALFWNYSNQSRYLSLLKAQQRNTGDLVFLKRTVSALKTEYENLSRETFDVKTSADFIANLPVLAEFSGVSQFTIQTRGTKTEGKQEVMTVDMELDGRFSALASFIDILERARLPIQIENLSMEYTPRLIHATMTLKIYYRR